MAQAKVTETRIVSKTFTLELSAEEVATLYDICMYVGGDLHNSRRKFADNVASALRDADPETFQWGKATKHDFRGDIFFSDNEEEL